MNNALVRMVSIFHPTSPTPRSLSKPLRIVPSAPITFGITVTLMFEILVLWRGPSSHLPFHFFLIFSLWWAGRENRLDDRVVFFVNHHYAWPFGGDKMIHLYHKISEKFIRLILQDGFWFVQVSFGSMVSFKFFAQFPVDHLPRPFMFIFIFSLRYFTKFFFYLIERFVSIIT